MKRYLVFLITAVLIIFVYGSGFAEIEIKAQVDKNKLTTDELLTYKLIITSTEKNTPQPQVPKFAGFDVVSQAQSTTVSFVKSNIKNIIIYAFILAPKDTGLLRIEYSQIKFKSKIFRTETFDIVVTKGKTQPETSPQQKPTFPEENQPDTKYPQVTI